MSDGDEKKHHWSTTIPLVSLLIVVFSAGAVVNEQRNLRKAMDEQILATNELAKEIRDITDRLDKRINVIEEWKTAHIASSTPLMQRFLEHELRNSRSGTRKE